MNGQATVATCLQDSPVVADSAQARTSLWVILQARAPEAEWLRRLGWRLHLWDLRPTDPSSSPVVSAIWLGSSPPSDWHQELVVSVQCTILLRLRTSQYHCHVVVPISEHQDTVGPMARSVADAAIILTVIAGKDPLDNYTSAQPPLVPDYSKALNASALRGARLGVARQFARSDVHDHHMLAMFNASLRVMSDLGATVMDPVDYPAFEEMKASDNETIVLTTDFKVGYRSGRDEQTH